MKQTKISFNLDGLEEMEAKIGRSYSARVGIIGGKAGQMHDGGISNAELGVIQMFGSLTNNIPARDFLLMPLMVKHREIIQSLQTGSMRSAFEAGDYKKMFVLLGIKAEQFVQEAFETGGFGRWAPNKPATIDRKGSSRPLINFGELRRSISSDVVDKSGQPTAGGHAMVSPP